MLLLNLLHHCRLLLMLDKTVLPSRDAMIASIDTESPSVTACTPIGTWQPPSMSPKKAWALDAETTGDPATCFERVATTGPDLEMCIRDRMKGLKGKTVVVTGASSGIGEALARECAVQAANVVLGARTLQKLQLIVGDIRSKGGEAKQA